MPRNLSSAQKLHVKLNESNKSGVWGRIPQLPEANGGLGMKPPTLWRFFQLITKNKAFFSVLQMLKMLPLAAQMWAPF